MAKGSFYFCKDMAETEWYANLYWHAGDDSIKGLLLLFYTSTLSIRSMVGFKCWELGIYIIQIELKIEGFTTLQRLLFWRLWAFRFCIFFKEIVNQQYEVSKENWTDNKNVADQAGR